MSNPAVVDCPICKKKVAWVPENKNRPFCSDRCRLIDLGEWAEGNRYIPEDADESDATSGDLDKD